MKKTQDFPAQPYLFEDMAFQLFQGDALRAGGKCVVDKLLKLRRSLEGAEHLFVTQINDCISNIRSITRMSDHQREEAILWSIERSGATTYTEIAEDTRLAVSVVKEIVAELQERGRLARPRKHVVGSDRPNYMFKSTRAGIPEAG